MEPPKRVTVNVPAALYSLMEKRIEEEKYDGFSAYFISLMLFDFYARKPHKLTGSIHHERPAARDKFFRWLAEKFDEPGERTGGWFEKRIKEIIAEEKLNKETK